MGTLKGGPFSSWSILKNKIFIMDRNDGECYVGKTKKQVAELYERFGDRFVEQLKTIGNWTWIILDRIPGHFKGGKINERLQRDFDTDKVY